MNKLVTNQVLKDYKEVLATEAGKRVFGWIFTSAGLYDIEKKSDYAQGFFNMGQIIATMVREVDPLGVAKCEIAYKNLEEMFDNGKRDTDNINYGGTD